MQISQSVLTESATLFVGRFMGRIPLKNECIVTQGGTYCFFLLLTSYFQVLPILCFVGKQVISKK